MQIWNQWGHSKGKQLTGAAVLLFLFLRGLKRTGSVWRYGLWALLALILVLVAADLFRQYRNLRASGQAEREGGLVASTPLSPAGVPGFLFEILELAGRHALLLLLVRRFDGYFFVLYRDYGSVFPALHRILVDLAIAEGLVLLANRVRPFPGGRADRQMLQQNRDAICRLFYIGFGYAYFLRFLRTTTWVSFIPDEHVLTQLCRLSVNLCLLIAVTEAALQKRRSILLLQLAILATGFFHYKLGGQRHYIYALCVLIVAASGKDYRRILQISLVEGLLVTLAAFGAGKAGYIKYLVREKSHVTRLRYALGSISPTDFSAHLLYFGISWCMLRKCERRWKEYLDYLLFLAAFLIAYRINVARTNSAMILLLFMGTFLKQTFGAPAAGAMGAVKGRDARKGRFRRTLVFGASLMGSFSFAIFFFYVLSQLPYKLGQMWMPWTKWIRKFTNTYTMRVRFRYAHRAYIKHPPTLFGNVIREVGNGSLEGTVKKYTFIDISYARVLLVGGIALTAVLIGGFTLWMLRCVKHRQYYYVFLMTIVAINCLMEHHLFEYFYNVFPLLFFAGGLFEQPASGGIPEAREAA